MFMKIWEETAAFYTLKCVSMLSMLKIWLKVFEKKALSLFSPFIAFNVMVRSTRNIVVFMTRIFYAPY